MGSESGSQHSPDETTIYKVSHQQGSMDTNPHLVPTSNTGIETPPATSNPVEAMGTQATPPEKATSTGGTQASPLRKTHQDHGTQGPLE